MLKCDIGIGSMSDCLSVCHTLVLIDSKSITIGSWQFSPMGSPGTLSFFKTNFHNIGCNDS